MHIKPILIIADKTSRNLNKYIYYREHREESHKKEVSFHLFISPPTQINYLFTWDLSLPYLSRIYFYILISSRTKTSNSNPILHICIYWYVISPRFSFWKTPLFSFQLNKSFLFFLLLIFYEYIDATKKPTYFHKNNSNEFIPIPYTHMQTNNQPSVSSQPIKIGNKGLQVAYVIKIVQVTPFILFKRYELTRWKNFIELNTPKPQSMLLGSGMYCVYTGHSSFSHQKYYEIQDRNYKFSHGQKITGIWFHKNGQCARTFIHIFTMKVKEFVKFQWKNQRKSSNLIFSGV